jgi:uncharacterized protein YjbJ (UPF0337 family)
MSVFDEAKDKAQDYMGQAKDKFGRQNDENQDDQQGEGMSGKADELRDKASDAMQNAKDRFGN